MVLIMSIIAKAGLSMSRIAIQTVHTLIFDGFAKCSKQRHSAQAGVNNQLKARDSSLRGNDKKG